MGQIAVRVGQSLLVAVAVTCAFAVHGNVAQALCSGDCDGDGQVVLGEVVTAVGVGLGQIPVARCQRLDADASGTLTIDEILRSVAGSLDECPAFHVDVERGGDPITVASPLVRVEIGREPFRLALFNRDGKEAFTRGPQEGGLFFDDGKTRHGLSSVTGAADLENGIGLTVATTADQPARVTIRFLTNRTLEVVFDPPAPDSATTLGASWESPASEVIYGLTERLRDSPPLRPGIVDIPADDIRPPEVGSLNRRGETVSTFILPTFSLYAPFYQSSRGYGVAVAGTMPGVFDVAKIDPGRLSFEFETGTIAENRRLVFHVFFGPDYASILDEYTRLTGRPHVPPDWAFLNWRWRGELALGAAELDGTEVNAQVEEDVRMFEDNGIPPGVYLFDRPVLRGDYGFGRFEWDEERIPNPDAMLASLRRRGYRIATWSGLWLCGSEPGDNGIEGQQLGYIAPGMSGTPRCDDTAGMSFIMDVTNADARTWFRDKLAAFIDRYEIDAIKLDRGEEHIPSAASDIWADGRNGREVHNDYVLLQTTLHHEALAAARPDGDFTLITRSGYTGAQKDAVFWGGDIPGSESFGFGPGTDLGLRSAIISQQRAAFLGFPIWGSDTGGYYEFKDREVFARWIEFSTFSGIMEIGGTGNHAPWDMPTEPKLDTEMIEIYRRYTQLRQDILGYIVRIARQAGQSGLPMVRPMTFLDPADPELADRWDQYLFGPDLMVAPVWRVGERSREVYFPRGAWRSLWDDSQRFEGPSTVAFDVPLDTILVFIRADARSPIAATSAER
jgi:alpha-D-xyloside xylohydrolase